MGRNAKNQQLWLTIVFLSLAAVLLALSLTGCGRTGPEGSPGRAGDRVTTRPATPSECPTGGLQMLLNGNPAGSVCNGASGQNGLNATQVSVVQFCPGTTSYPSTFLEVGLCISGSLYAVYSIPGAFLSYIPPGHYYSTGVNSHCDFNVLANCVIQ